MILCYIKGHSPLLSPLFRKGNPAWLPSGVYTSQQGQPRRVAPTNVGLGLYTHPSKGNHAGLPLQSPFCSLCLRSTSNGGKQEYRVALHLLASARYYSRLRFSSQLQSIGFAGQMQ